MIELASTVVTAAVVFALSSGAPASLLGSTLEPGRPSPAGVTGLLLTGAGVAHLGEGARVTLSEDRESLSIDAGSVRVAAVAPFVVSAGDVTIMTRPETILLVTRDGAALEACVLTGEAQLRGLPPQSPGDTGEEGDAQGDNGRSRIAAGACRRVAAGVVTSPAGEGVAARAAALRRAAEGAPPPPIEPPDVLGDLEGDVAEIESQWSEALEQGPRQEASSCGCAEDGGSSGGLDPSGNGSPDPEPEHPGQGTIRVRIRLPAR